MRNLTAMLEGTAMPSADIVFEQNDSAIYDFDFKTPLKRGVCLSVFFLFFYALYPQSNPVSFRQLGLVDGLSQNSVVAIAQDSLGLLWFATQDGINRYDGYTFTYYERYFWDITRSDKVLLGQLLTDRNGTLWILPDTGIPEKYDLGSDRFLPVDGLSEVRCFFQDQHGHLYFGTTDGLFRQKLGRTDIEKIWTEPVKFGLVGRQDEIWVLSGNEVFKSNGGGEFENVAVATGFDHQPHLTYLLEDREGQIWLGSFGDGLLALDEAGMFKPYFSAAQQTAAVPKKILSIFQDQKNNLWIGTYGQGAFMIDLQDADCQQYKSNKQDSNSIGYNDILDIKADGHGILWFGTDGAGLSFYDENLTKFNGFTNAQVPANIQIDVVRALLIDDGGNTWIGTSGKGLTRYNPAGQEVWKTFTPANSNMHSSRIMSLAKGIDGKIWIGTQGDGLEIYTPQSETFQQIAPGQIGDHTIWDIHIVSKNRAWLCTRNAGLVLYDLTKGKIEHFDVEHSAIPSNNVRTIIDAKQSDCYWVGTCNNGFAYFDAKKMTFRPFENPKEIGKIKCLYLSKDNMLWIGTNGNGVEVLDVDRDAFYRYGVGDGLPNNVIYGILPDGEGHLWLSSNRGLSCLVPPEDLSGQVPLDITVYDNYDGLQGYEFNTGAYCKDRQNNLYFGGINGYNWFAPGDLKQNPHPPKVILTDCQVNGQSVYPEVLFADGLELEHSQNDLSFGFTTDGYSLPQRNRFRYQLVGYDQSEVDAGNRRFVQYTNLPPAQYQFVVKACNYDGVWNESGAIFNIHILRPWYRRWWVYALALAFCFFGGAWMANYIKNQIIFLRKRLLVHYAREALADIPEEEDTPATQFLTRLESVIHDNLSNTDFQVGDLCKAIGMSRTQLHRKMKALTGESTSHYIRNFRLLEGKRLLEDTDMNISEVAYAIGYKHPNHFSAQFKTYFGIPPADFRKG